MLEAEASYSNGEPDLPKSGAPEAQTLYEETAQSIAAREEAAALRKAGALGMQTDGRPSKKQRRQIQLLRDFKPG